MPAVAFGGGFRDSGRRRRSRHRDHHRARADRLGARHRSAHADRRRAKWSAAAARNSSSRTGRPRGAPERPTDQMGQFVAAVLGNTEDTWTEIFAQGGTAIPRAAAACSIAASEQGGCGFAQAAMGPFYCPSDQRVYLDTSFFRDIERASAAASGKACEFVAGLCDRARGRPSRAEPARHSAEGASTRNAPPAARRRPTALQVRVELQADCFAGVWAQPLQQALEVDRAGRHRGGAADRRGDRRRPLQKQAQRLCGAGFLHPRHVGAAQALVHDRLQRRQTVGLQYFRGGANRCSRTDVTCPASTKADNSCRSRSRC